jgi:hypothetical protein
VIGDGAAAQWALGDMDHNSRTARLFPGLPKKFKPIACIAPFVPYSGAHNPLGEGESRKNLKRLCSFAPQRAPGDRVTRTAGSLFPKTERHKTYR